jgi:hypothetical protein
MISNKNLASISDKQNSGNIQDGGVQVNVEQNASALRKTGRTSRKGSLQSSRNNSRCNSTERSPPHQNLTHGNVILVTNFLKTKMINC